MATRFDKPQLTAIEHTLGPLLVIAGAGTGKTTVIVERVARLINTGCARPEEILVLTYAENAASELQQRVQQRLPNVDCTPLKACTFHAYGYKLLCGNGQKFDPLTKEDLWVFLRRNLAQLQLDRFIKAADPGEFLDHLLSFFDRCHDELVGPTQYSAYVEKVRRRELPPPRVGKSKDELPFDEIMARCDELARVYTTVDEMLRSRGLGTFGDMITNAVAFLHANPKVLAQAQAGARFILIDEFQDSNRGQIELAALLAGKEQNVFAVGDPDQAIYRFRGASSGAFEQFLQRFPGSAVVRLERNYRSTSSILRCAFASISKNPDFAAIAGSANFRRQVLISAREQNAVGKAKPKPVAVVIHPDGTTEAYNIAASICEEHRRNPKLAWSDFAVLYRSNVHRNDLVEELALKGIPFVVAGLNVLKTAPVLDLLAALRCVHSDFDAISLFRLAAMPKFKVEAEKLRAACHNAKRGTNLTDLLRAVPGGFAVLEALQECRRLFKQESSLTGLIAASCRAFSLDRQLPPIQALVRFVKDWQNKSITEIGDLRELLEYFDYFEQADGKIELPPEERRDAVRLYTVHSAKGLEFRYVYVLRVSSGTFPVHYREALFDFPPELRNAPSLTPENDKQLQSEEERRLFYVAMTRARDQLTLCAKPGRGQKDTSPAGYLRELMKDRHIADALVVQHARAYQASLAAAAQAQSPLAEWMYLPPTASEGPHGLSATAIALYEQCPLQFKMARDWRLPAEPTGALQFGNVMHTVLKFYYDRVLAGEAPSQEILLAKFDEALDTISIADPIQRALYSKQGIAQLVAFLNSMQSAPPTTTLHTERTFEVQIGGARVTGRIDRIDAIENNGCVAITDYKTGKARTQEDADKNLQLSLYALAAKQAWNLEVKKLAFHNLENNTIVETSRTLAELAAAEQTVREVAANIAEERFDAKPGRHCRLCSYRSLCPTQEQPIYDLTGDAQVLSAKVH